MSWFHRNGKGLLLVGLVLVLVGARAEALRFAGNPTPLGDEWDGDMVRLLQPYLHGDLTLGDLFRFHNEHVVFFTRLTTLAVFKASGYWDVVLQMIVNAILDAATVVALGLAFSRVLTGAWAWTALILAVLLNVLPLSWENILLGFNTHFYLLLSLSFAGLWLLAKSPAWSPHWILGAAFAGAANLCMASGALTPAAAAGLHVLQSLRGRREGMRDWLGIAALIALTIALGALALGAAGSGELRANSPGRFLEAFVQLIGWPLVPALAVLTVAPTAAFCVLTIADRPPLSDPRWFNVAGYGWIVTQILALALGRGELGIQNRYLDTLLVGLTINIVSALWLARSAAASRERRIWPYLTMALWLAIVVVSLAHTSRHTPGDMDARRRSAAVQEENVRAYLATKDASHLAGVPLVDIPYFDASDLQKLLDTPEIRAALTPALIGKDPPRDWVETFKDGFLGHGLALVGIGLLLSIAAVAVAMRGPRLGRTPLRADGG